MGRKKLVLLEYINRHFVGCNWLTTRDRLYDGQKSEPVDYKMVA